MRPQCVNCRYFAPEPMAADEPDAVRRAEDIDGDCRRHGPVAREPAEEGRQVNYAYWPIVLGGDWCGEHRPNSAKPAGEARENASIGS